MVRVLFVDFGVYNAINCVRWQYLDSPASMESLDLHWSHAFRGVTPSWNRNPTVASTFIDEYYLFGLIIGSSLDIVVTKVLVLFLRNILRYFLSLVASFQFSADCES